MTWTPKPDNTATWSETAQTGNTWDDRTQSTPDYTEQPKASNAYTAQASSSSKYLHSGPYLMMEDALSFIGAEDGTVIGLECGWGGSYAQADAQATEWDAQAKADNDYTDKSAPGTVWT